MSSGDVSFRHESVGVCNGIQSWQILSKVAVLIWWNKVLQHFCGGALLAAFAFTVVIVCGLLDFLMPKCQSFSVCMVAQSFGTARLI